MVVESSAHRDSLSALEVYFDRLITHLDLIGDHNPVAIIARYHWNRVLRLIAGESMPPLVWEINPSGICNVHCSFCLYPNTDKVLMPKEHFFNLVAEAKELGARAVIDTCEHQVAGRPEIELLSVRRRLYGDDD